MIHVCVLSCDGSASQFYRVSAAVRDASSYAQQRVRLWWLEQAARHSYTSGSAMARIWMSPFNAGCAGGRQRLLDWITTQEALEPTDRVAFLDDDLQFRGSSWLLHWIEAHDQLPAGRGVVGQEGRCITADFHTQECSSAPDYLSGGWSMWSARLFHDGLHFDPRYDYWEDVDLCYRARAMGAVLLAAPHPDLTHSSHSTQDKSRRYMAGRQLFMAQWGHRV